MDQQIVTDAVRTLRTRGERVSVRAVHGLTGGSFRDVSRLLRDAREYLAEDEAAELDADVPAPVLTPSLGRIAEASMAVRAAEAALAEASTALYEKHMELRALQAAPPVRRTRPEDILQELNEEDEHAEQCQSLKRHIAKLERIVAQRQAEALALRADHERLLGLLRQIETSAIPAARRRRGRIPPGTGDARRGQPGARGDARRGRCQSPPAALGRGTPRPGGGAGRPWPGRIGERG